METDILFFLEKLDKAQNLEPLMDYSKANKELKKVERLLFNKATNLKQQCDHIEYQLNIDIKKYKIDKSYKITHKNIIKKVKSLDDRKKELLQILATSEPNSVEVKNANQNLIVIKNRYSKLILELEQNLATTKYEINEAKNWLSSHRPRYNKIKDVEKFFMKYLFSSLGFDLLFGMLKLLIIYFSFFLTLSIDKISSKLELAASEYEISDPHLAVLALVFIIQLIIIDKVFSGLNALFNKKTFKKRLPIIKKICGDLNKLETELRSL